MKDRKPTPKVRLTRKGEADYEEAYMALVNILAIRGKELAPKSMKQVKHFCSTTEDWAEAVRKADMVHFGPCGYQYAYRIPTTTTRNICTGYTHKTMLEV